MIPISLPAGQAQIQPLRVGSYSHTPTELHGPFGFARDSAVHHGDSNHSDNLPYASLYNSVAPTFNYTDTWQYPNYTQDPPVAQSRFLLAAPAPATTVPVIESPISSLPYHWSNNVFVSDYSQIWPLQPFQYGLSSTGGSLASDLETVNHRPTEGRGPPPVASGSPLNDVPTVPASRASPDSTANVERITVGSRARTRVAMSNRKKEPKYFCKVSGCRSKGFTQKHNLECESDVIYPAAAAEH